MKTAVLLLAITLPAAGAAVSALADDTTGTTTYESPGWQSEGKLKDEIIGFKPQVGVLAFTDSYGSSVPRALEGVTIDLNLMPPLARSMGDQSYTVFFAGITTGGLYSHLGSDTSNFFGTSPTSSVTNAGTNMVLIPADIKLGWNAGGGNYRLSAHGGGNIIYRNDSTSLNLGPGAAGTDIWRIYPNAGLDLEAGIGSNISLMLRPDLTFTPGQDFFVGTVGLSIFLG